jgi:predicted phage terminase large subunit-like protein
MHMMELTRNSACFYLMEQVFMQDVLVKEVCDAGRRIGRPIPIKGDTRQKPDKYMRIESLLEPMHRNGDLYLNETERYNPHMVRLSEQFMAFAPGSRAHDDGPDAVEGAVWYMVNRDAIGKIADFAAYERHTSNKHW